MPALANLAHLLLLTHLDVCVSEKHLADLFNASLNAGLPSTSFAAYALLPVSYTHLTLPTKRIV